MPVLVVELIVKRDGVPLAGFPLVRRLSVDEVQEFETEEANDGNTTTWSAVPASDLDTLQFVCLRTDQNITLRLDSGIADAAANPTLPLQQGGVLILISTNIDAGAGVNNARVNNNSGAVARLRGVIGGT